MRLPSLKRQYAFLFDDITESRFMRKFGLKKLKIVEEPVASRTRGALGRNKPVASRTRSKSKYNGSIGNKIVENLLDFRCTNIIQSNPAYEILFD
ncbi:hypothetical protein G9A89_012688 [Geosiphon pyriformis]|nr:hypothetical protein G9A89_012688 [Geosiphon pyriformis]